MKWDPDSNTSEGWASQPRHIFAVATSTSIREGASQAGGSQRGLRPSLRHNWEQPEHRGLAWPSEDLWSPAAWWIGSGAWWDSKSSPRWPASPETGKIGHGFYPNCQSHARITFAISTSTTSLTLQRLNSVLLDELMKRNKSWEGNPDVTIPP